MKILFPRNKFLRNEIPVTEQHPYLGILFHKALSWSGHITNIANKASRIFNFLRNLSKFSPTVKASSYLTLVRPIMEYAASVWDPYYHNDIQTLEKVQRRAARWVMNDYSWYSSVSNMLNNLNWPPLQLRRRIMDDIDYSRIRVIYVLRPCVVEFALRNVRYIFRRKMALVVFNILLPAIISKLQ